MEYGAIWETHICPSLLICLYSAMLLSSSQIFDCPRLKFSEIPQRLTNLLLPPDPIVINHVIR